MVTGNNHQRQQNDLGGIGSLNGLDDLVDQRSTLDSTDKVIGITGSMQALLQTGVGGISLMMGTVTHEDDGRAFDIVLGSLFHQGSNQSIVVIIGSQQRIANLHGIELISIVSDFCHHIVILEAGHHMGGLNDNFLDTVSNKAVHSLGNVVNFHSLTLFQNVNNNLAGKSTADLVLRVSCLQGGFHSTDGHVTGLIVAGAEGNSQQDRFCFCCSLSFGSSTGGFRCCGGLRSFLCAASYQAKQHAANQQQRNNFSEFHLSSSMEKCIYLNALLGGTGRSRQ